MKNNKIIHVTNTETQHGYKGNTGKIASLLTTGMLVSQVITEAFEKHGLEEKQVKTALSNLKNRTDLFVYISEQDYLELVNSTLGTSISVQEGEPEFNIQTLATSPLVHVQLTGRALRKVSGNVVLHDIKNLSRAVKQPEVPVNQKEVEDELIKRLPKKSKEQHVIEMKEGKTYRGGSAKEIVYSCMHEGDKVSFILSEAISLGLTTVQAKQALNNIVFKDKVAHLA